MFVYTFLSQLSFFFLPYVFVSDYPFSSLSKILFLFLYYVSNDFFSLNFLFMSGLPSSLPYLLPFFNLVLPSLAFSFFFPSNITSGLCNGTRKHIAEWGSCLLFSHLPSGLLSSFFFSFLPFPPWLCLCECVLF